MCVSLSPRDLNPDPYPPHLTSTCTCEMTIALRMYGDILVSTTIHTHVHARVYMCVNFFFFFLIIYICIIVYKCFPWKSKSWLHYCLESLLIEIN